MVETPTWFHIHEVILTAMIYLAVGFSSANTRGYDNIKIFLRYIFHLMKIEKSSANCTIHKFSPIIFFGS